MFFFTQHLLQILNTYKGHPPLSLFLRTYFKAYPKLGSRDRKALSEAVYIYFRCRKFFNDSVSDEQVIAYGYRLCKSENAFLGKILQSYLNEECFTEPVFQEKYLLNISNGITAVEWLQSMWQQPELFIRLRKSCEASLKILKENNVSFEVMRENEQHQVTCIRIPNGKAIDSLLPDADYVVQDWSSQKSIYILLQYLKAKPESIWDVCSGAGGKSILLKDTLPGFDLTVSDIRENILHNLKMRFRQYHLGKINSIVINSSDADAVDAALGPQQFFDLVLCDVPCSGSGTWARTPEQFHFYEPEMLQKFKGIQFPIANNASRYVKPGGFLVYITCSVFEEENESVVNQLAPNDSLVLKHQQIINGIQDKADCMFLAIFEKQ